MSYDPERKILITKEQHVKIHGHGTGPVKGYKKRRWGFKAGFFVGLILSFAVVYRYEIHELVMSIMSLF